MKNTVVFDRPGASQREIMNDMRAELRKLLKTPRNAPCPCGATKNGRPKKFKVCCLKSIP